VIKGDGDKMVLIKKTCKFGEVEMNIGDRISSVEDNIQCKCEMPPMLHCIQNPNAD
jgi:hypothetical protein